MTSARAQAHSDCRLAAPPIRLVRPALGARRYTHNRAHIYAGARKCPVSGKCLMASKVTNNGEADTMLNWQPLAIGHRRTYFLSKPSRGVGAVRMKLSF